MSSCRDVPCVFWFYAGMASKENDIGGVMLATTAIAPRVQIPINRSCPLLAFDALAACMHRNGLECISLAFAKI